MGNTNCVPPEMPTKGVPKTIPSTNTHKIDKQVEI